MTELLLRVNGIQAGLRHRVRPGQPAGQRRPSRRSLPAGQRLLLAGPAARRPGRAAHADRLRHGRRAVAVGVRAHATASTWSTRCCSPIRTSTISPSSTGCRCACCGVAGRPAPSAADLCQPGVLGKRPQPRPSLPGRAERLPPASAGHRRRAGGPHRHALRRGPRPEGPRCPGVRRPARQPEDRHHGRLPAGPGGRQPSCCSTPT